MGLIGHKKHKLFALQLQLVYLTCVHPSIYMHLWCKLKNLYVWTQKAYSFETLHVPVHDLVDVYKFSTQDAPGLITGPVLGLRHLYVGIC